MREFIFIDQSMSETRIVGLSDLIEHIEKMEEQEELSYQLTLDLLCGHDILEEITVGYYEKIRAYDYRIKEIILVGYIFCVKE